MSDIWDYKSSSKHVSNAAKLQEQLEAAGCSPTKVCVCTHHQPVVGTVVCSEGTYEWVLKCNTLSAGCGVAVDGIATDKDIFTGMGQPDQAWTIFFWSKSTCNGVKCVASYGPQEFYATPVTVAVRLDMEEGTLSYTINGADAGVAFRGLQGKRLRLVAALQFPNKNDWFELLSSSDPKPKKVAAEEKARREAAERALNWRLHLPRGEESKGWRRPLGFSVR